MYRTNNCGELNSSFVDQEVKLSGWVNKIRTKGFIIWIDLRDRYGVTQLVFDNDRTSKEVYEKAQLINREYEKRLRNYRPGKLPYFWLHHSSPS